MNIFDIIGPVMVGPSSSHTAGAVKIGRIARKLMAEDIICADIFFHGSFAATGKGHGTDKAVIAGLLGMECDDSRIPDSFAIAKDKGLEFNFTPIDLGEEAHPNSVKLMLKGNRGKELSIVACSIGGGQILVKEIDGLKMEFAGDYPTLIVENDDRQGMVAMVTMTLARNGINIATVQLDREHRGGHAVTVIECDQEINETEINWLRNLDGIIKVTYLSLKEEA